MRKFTKLMLTLAFVFAGVGGIKAERVYANPSDGTQTWTAVSNTFTWTATSNNFIITGLPTGDISAYTNFHCTVSNFSENVNFIRLVLKNGKDNQITEYINAGEFNIDLVSKYPTWDFTCVTDFLLFGSNGATEGHSIDAEHPASAVVTDIYLEKPNSFVFDAFGKASINKTGLTATGGLSYDPSTGLLTSDGTKGTLTLELATPTDLRNVFHFNVSRSGSDNIVDRLRFYDEDNNLINTWNGIKWSNTWNANGIDDNATNAFLNHKPVKKLVWESDEAGTKDGLTLTITSVEFTLKTMSCAKAGETQLKTLAWNKIDDSGTATPDWNMNGTSDTYYGNYSGDATHYVDLTDYSELRVYCSSNSDGFRAFFIKSDGTGTETKATSSATWHATEKYYSLDLSTITKWNNKVALKSIKSDPWSGTTTGQNVTNIVVYNTPATNAPQYILTGSGMQLAETVAALADATATCIDATGVTGITTNSEAGRTLLESANPNCLFLGTTGNGGLANTQNVITSGTCANLVLTDGYPFKAPNDFTATAASYSRTFTANAIQTICLPFALNEETAAAAGKFYELTAAETGNLTFTSVAATEANKPYLFKPASTDPTLSAASAAIVATASANCATTVNSVTFQGVMNEETIAPASGNTLFAYTASGEFVKISSSATLKGMRAYLIVPNALVSASRMNITFDDEASGISDVEKMMNNENETVFDLQGRRVLQPAKGLYIINGKKVILK